MYLFIHYTENGTGAEEQGWSFLYFVNAEVPPKATRGSLWSLLDCKKMQNTIRVISIILVKPREREKALDAVNLSASV